MKKILLGLLFSGAFFYICEPLLYADSFKGEIVRLGQDNQSFVLNAEVVPLQKKEIEFWLTTESKFKGLSSLAEIAKGDEVIVNAQRNKATGKWEADTVEILKVVIHDPGSEVPVPEQIIEEKLERT